MADITEDPFQSIGGGVKLANGDWVPKDHVKAIGAPAQPGAAPAASGAAPAGTPGATNVQDQAAASQTYSATPGAAPGAATTNAGTQDTVRNSYLQQATQPATVDRNDPNVRAQSDAFRAQVDRSARNAMGDAAEAAGPYATGALRGQERMLHERAGQAAGSMEAQLIANELKSKRGEIQLALQNLGAMVESDQGRALQRELAAIDAQLKSAGLDVQSSLGSRELDVKDRLGTGSLNLEGLRLLLQNQQFGDQLGLQVGDREAYWNNAALSQLL